LAAAAAALSCVAPAGAAPTASCPIQPGGHIVLASDAVDPDVFLWDGRDHLIEYASGHWGPTRVILAHTSIAKEGTRAVVVHCVPAIVHPRYSPGPQDLVGVRVMSGPLRGHYGWVLSSDMHADDDARNIVNH
jgi:hypothetical protein